MAGYIIVFQSVVCYNFNIADKNKFLFSEEIIYGHERV